MTRFRIILLSAASLLLLSRCFMTRAVEVCPDCPASTVACTFKPCCDGCFSVDGLKPIAKLAGDSAAIGKFKLNIRALRRDAETGACCVFPLISHYAPCTTAPSLWTIEVVDSDDPGKTIEEGEEAAVIITFSGEKNESMGFSVFLEDGRVAHALRASPNEAIPDSNCETPDGAMATFRIEAKVYEPTPLRIEPKAVFLEYEPTNTRTAQQFETAFEVSAVGSEPIRLQEPIVSGNLTRLTMTPASIDGLVVGPTSSTSARVTIKFSAVAPREDQPPRTFTITIRGKRVETETDVGASFNITLVPRRP